MILAIDLMDETNEVTEEAQRTLLKAFFNYTAEKKTLKKTPSCLLHL